MPFGFFKTRKRSNPKFKSKSKYKSKKISPRTRKLQRIIKTIIPIQNNYKKKFKNFDICAICQEFMINPSMRQTLPCGHVFHRACIEKSDSNDKRCPLCRKFFLYEEIVQDMQDKNRELEGAYGYFMRLSDIALSVQENYYQHIDDMDPNNAARDPTLHGLEVAIRQSEENRDQARQEYEEAIQAYDEARQWYETYQTQMLGPLGT